MIGPSANVFVGELFLPRAGVDVYGCAWKEQSIFPDLGPYGWPSLSWIHCSLPVALQEWQTVFVSGFFQIYNFAREL